MKPWWSLPLPTLNNYILECESETCGVHTFIYWRRKEIPGYDDPDMGMRCPKCFGKRVALADCDERLPQHRAALEVYRAQHPELFPTEEVEGGQ